MVGQEVCLRDAAVDHWAAAPAQARDFVLTLWTDDPRMAALADEAGVDRIGLDLEVRGKRERQAGLGTWISGHSVKDLPAVAASLTDARLFARVNPLWPGSRTEVHRLLEMGVEVLMLPMFTTVGEVEELTAIVAGEAAIVLLLETASAIRAIDRIVRVPGVSEVHVGINDLSLSMGMKSRFEVLDCELIEEVSRTVRAAGLRFGIGGIGRVDDLALPISSDLVYAQYPRLGASAALLSRAFTRGGCDLRLEVARARARIARWATAPADELERARARLGARLKECDCW